MSKIEEHEPTEEMLHAASDAHRVELVSYNRTLEKLEPKDFLRRYNRLRIKVQRLSDYPNSLIYLTVRRHRSKIGAENFYTVPFFVEDLRINAIAEYDLLSFDSFNLPFDSISIEMCDFKDYQKRRISKLHLERARKFVSPVQG